VPRGPARRAPSGRVDQAPLVSLGIEEDLEGAGFIVLDLADPMRTEPFSLRSRGGDVGDLDIEVRPRLVSVGGRRW
jgi:hypothetical protein